MKILVVDLEATCWKDGIAPKGEHQEIIEIGYCLFDLTTLERSDKTSILIIPTRSRVSKFCTDLTSLTQEQVDQGITFYEACDQIEHYKHLPWSAWGDWDLKIMKNQCKAFGVQMPFSSRHINIKQLFSTVFNVKKLGMQEALKICNIQLEGHHHRGHDDAWNTALLLKEIYNKGSFTLDKLVYEHHSMSLSNNAIDKQ
jgi:inhibitor of KinA sporulation pathway (predicted exonuclease)